MLLLGRSVRGNPLLFSLPSPVLEVSRPIVHLLGFRASPKIPTSNVFLRQASKWSVFCFKKADFSFKMAGFSFKMVGFSFKMVDFSFKMVDSSFKMAGFRFKTVGFSVEEAICSFWLARVRLARVRLSTLRFRVFTFLIERCCGHQGLYERGCTPPIGAKPCSCTCCARP